jgi:RNA-directed DNA polymerase
MTGTPIPEEVSTRLQRIAMLAREDPERAFLSLAHHIDVDLLREAYRRTRKDGAAGVDGETAAQYGKDLDERLKDLEGRFKSGSYYAPPVRRTYIPKGDGKTKRPIGIPSFEDKVLQRAVKMVLEAVYEEDFADCSYGSRPGRSAHDALGALWRGLMEMGGGWVLELDIKSYFDTLEHSCLRKILDQRVRDGVIRRTIDKWLAAGVWEAGRVSYPTAGTPQGGVVSPLLANVYLHEVLDVWFAKDVKPRLRGRGSMVRYVDDAVLVFSNEADAREVKDLLAKRFSQWGLSLHPDKTRLLEFRPVRPEGDRKGGLRSFDFLGFTHHWGRSKKGRWVVKQETAGSRMRRTLKRLNRWCRRYRHHPVVWQHKRLSRALQGWDNYYGYATNQRSLKVLRFKLTRMWRKWLSRRTRGAPIPWKRFNRLLARFPFPAPSVHRRGWALAANPSC